MNPWQTVQQIAWLASRAVWPGTSDAVCDVMISARSPADLAAETAGGQFCIVVPAGDTGDIQEPTMLEGRHTLWLASQVVGDRIGVTSLLGAAPIAGDAGDHRGLLEIEAPVLSAVSKLTGANGKRAVCSYRSSIIPSRIDGTEWLWRSYTVGCVSSRDRYYHPPLRLVKNGDTVTWTLPPSRFDTLRIVLRRADGTTSPPAGPTDGVPVVLSGDLDTSVSDAAGTPHAYSVFAAYDDVYDDAPSVERAYSEPVRGSTLAVT